MLTFVNPERIMAQAFPGNMFSGDAPLGQELPGASPDFQAEMTHETTPGPNSSEFSGERPVSLQCQ
jgi:hypothetical protein